jgi:hypothetical protein
MPEIIDLRVCLPAITCFPDLESRILKDLILIPCCLFVQATQPLRRKSPETRAALS